MKFILCSIFLLLALFSKSQHRAGKIKILDSISAKHTKISICGQDHYHPVDIKAKLIFDSLKVKGIDTLLIFRHWLGMNGFNGYGKVLWLDKGILKQFSINFINRAPYYGIKSIDFTTIIPDSVLSFYFQNNLSAVKSNPIRKSEFLKSHDSNYFVYLEAGNEVYCFDIDGLIFQDNPDNLRIKFLKKLLIEPSKYIDAVYGRD